jgi:hypothetical protein
MDNRPVIGVNYGLASSYPDCIEVNHKLSTILREKVIKHEHRHSRNKHYTKEDFKNDFQSKSSYFKDSLKFALFNPEALIGFFPFMYSYYKKIMTLNSSALYPFLYFGLLFSGFFWLVVHVNFFLAFLGYTVMLIVLNCVLLFMTHMIVRRDKGFIYKPERR